MVIILIGILLFISSACFMEGKKEDRKGLKLILSIAIAIMLPLFMRATAIIFVNNEIMQGTLLLISYFTLPILSFSIFQLLLYNIRILE